MIITKRPTKFIGVIFLLGAASIFSSCVTATVSPEQRRAIETKEFDGSFEDTFKATLTVLQDRGYMIQNSDYEGGVIQAKTGSQTQILGSAEYMVSVTTEPLSEKRTRQRITALRENYLNLGQYGTSKSSSQIVSPELQTRLFQDIQSEIYRRQSLRKGRGFQDPTLSQPVYVVPGTNPPGAGSQVSSSQAAASKTVQKENVNVLNAIEAPPTIDTKPPLSKKALEERGKLLQEYQKQIEIEHQLLEEKKKLAEKQKEIEGIEKREVETEDQELRAKASQMALRLTDSNIKAIGLAVDVDNLMFGSKANTETTVFSVANGQVTWFCIFNVGFKGVGTSFARPKYTAIWYGPDKKVKQSETFTYSFGNARLFRNTLKMDQKHPELFIGKWRIEVWKKDKLFDEREFEIAA